MEKKGKSLKRLGSVKRKTIEKNLNAVNVSATNSFNEYEKILLAIMEKIEKDPKAYERNGEIEMPYEMREFLSKVCKRDAKDIDEVFKEVLKKIEIEKSETNEKTEYDNLVTLVDALRSNNNSNTNKDLKLEEFIKVLGWNENKFYENVKKMCSEQVYNIDIGKFKKAGETKEDYYDDERNFCFKKEWNDIAILLFKMFGENPYYRANSKATSASLDSVIKYNEKFLEAIKNDINEYNSMEIRLHSVYYSTYAENLAIKKVNEKLQLFFSLMSEVPVESRANMWIEISNKIDEAIIKNYVWSKQAKKEAETDKGELFKNQMYGEYEHISLDKYVAQVLKNEMNPQFREERLEINRKKHEWMKIFNRVAMNLDGAEEVARVNELWEKNEGEKKKVINIKRELEQEIDSTLKEKEKSVDDNTNINNMINVFIDNQRKCGMSENVLILEELKKVIAQKNNNTENVKNVVENIIQQVNFNVMSRK